MSQEDDNVKPILRNPSKHGKKKKTAKFDEKNILETYHPADKDYGHMKIDEPDTPYNYGNESKSFDPEEVRERLLKGGNPKVLTRKTPRFDDNDEDDEELAEKKAKHEEFLRKRKEHYNEFKTHKLTERDVTDEAIAGSSKISNKN